MVPVPAVPGGLRPILFFVAAKKNGPRPILFFVAAKKIGRNGYENKRPTFVNLLLINVQPLVK